MFKKLSTKKIMIYLALLVCILLVGAVMLTPKMLTRSNLKFIDKTLGTEKLLQNHTLLPHALRTFDNGEYSVFMLAEGDKNLVEELHGKFTFTKIDAVRAKALYVYSPYDDKRTPPTDSSWEYASNIVNNGNNRYEILTGKDTGTVLILVRYPDHAGDQP